ncbi:MerR family DNA-binding transcriptional regulator [Planococcus sp. X10-3]|uniref:MerR family DNA-binding transcriptional regulator n=1 Tax=Planococcus sp. X10-3 TaxID=3061240 RepID=UPI003BB0FC9F
MHKISEFSELTGLSKETLRYYEKAGLLEPAHVDPANNYRFYDDGSYFLAILLVQLRKLGFSIQEMLAVMNDESFARLEAIVIEKRDNVHRQITQMNQQLNDIDEFLASGRGE